MFILFLRQKLNYEAMERNNDIKDDILIGKKKPPLNHSTSALAPEPMYTSFRLKLRQNMYSALGKKCW